MNKLLIFLACVFLTGCNECVEYKRIKLVLVTKSIYTAVQYDDGEFDILNNQNVSSIQQGAQVCTMVKR